MAKKKAVKKPTKKKPAKKKAPKKRASRAKNNPTSNPTDGAARKAPRKPGRPKASEKAVTPAVLETIAAMFARGETLRIIADAVGIHFTTVQHHLKTTVQPLWREGMVVEAHVEMARVGELERTAWRKFESCAPITREQLRHECDAAGVKGRLVERIETKISREGDPSWLHVVQWCLDHKAKVGGLYAAAKFQIDHGGEIRVAGMSPTELDEQALAMILAKIKERREYAEAQKRLAG